MIGSSLCNWANKRDRKLVYTLYGAEVSYFTGKARAFMRWKGLEFQERAATREIYSSVIMPRVGWPVIPVVAGPDDEILQDTSDIIDVLDARHGAPSVFPEGPVQKLVALLFELLGDEWLVLPAMHYRWTKNRDFAYAEFGKLSAPDASAEEQFAIGQKIAVNFEGALPVLGIDAVTGPSIETAYVRLLGQLEAHFKTHDYLLGSRPSIGDYGLVGPLYAHQYRDPASGDLMKQVAPHVAQWVLRMQNPPAPLSGEFLSDDEIPETLLPILADQFQDQFPVLRSTAEAVTKWASEHSPGDDVPRGLGMHAFKLGEAEGQRMIFPFNLWMLQRPLDQYRSLSGDAKASASALLSKVGGEAFSAFPEFPRIARKDYKMVLA